MKIIQTLSTIEKAILLSELDLFKEVEADDLALIASKLSEYHFDPGETLEKESEAGTSLHFIVEGCIEASREGIQLRRVSKGMYFGLLGLLGMMENEVFRSAAPTHTLALSRENFERAVADDPQFALSMIRSITGIALEFARRLEVLEKGAGKKCG